MLEHPAAVKPRPLGARLRPLLCLAGVTLLATACMLAGRAVMPWEKVFPDFISYWTAAELIAGGGNPYDVDLQTRSQREHGWHEATDGRGVLAFLPYYYPPWFGAAFTALLPLGFEAGKAAWFFLNLEMLFLTGVLLAGCLPGLPRTIPALAFPLSFFGYLAVILGQTSILIAFLAVMGWRLLARGRDGAAGIALALLTTKPQLTLILVMALLAWSARRRRWRVIRGFALTLAGLSLAGALIVPSWPTQMLQATRQTPPPTDYYPWLGATWFLVLKAVGLRSWGLWALYLVVALPIIREVVKSSLGAARPLGDVMALGLLAPFFVVPYGRHYDFPVLLIPFFILLAGRLPEKVGSAMLFALVVLPYLQFVLLVKYSRLLVGDVAFFVEATYFWVPMLVAAAWLLTRPRSSASGVGGR